MDRIITTQLTSYEYLIERGFCRSDRIDHLFGGVVPAALHRETSQPYVDRRQPLGGRPLQVCFVAHKYTPTGREKGYDVFIDVVNRLSQSDNVNFHVVGGFDRATLPVKANARITFHGLKPADFFPPFYSSMDIILSPNFSVGMLETGRGIFDGFPTTCVVEAGVYGAAMFMTDCHAMNRHLSGSPIFRPGVDAEIISRNAEKIAELIAGYSSNSAALESLQRNGREALLREFNYDKQMLPRLEIMNSLLS
jgi:glycosyltransferase involved in cell wall biosynthesis